MEQALWTASGALAGSVGDDVAFLAVYANDIDMVAEHYGISRAEVEAALA